MSETIVNYFTSNLSGRIPKELIVLLISMVPILELRGGLLAASLLRIDMYQAIVICIIGNLIPIPFILLFIKKILEWMKTKGRLAGVVHWIETRSQSKSENIQKYKFFGLLFFVGIPLPGTGAWTGALISALINLDLKKAMGAILGGICMASVIMVMIAYGIPAMIRMI